MLKPFNGVRNPYALLPPSQRLLAAARKAGIDDRDKAAVDRWAKESGWINGQSATKGH